MTAIATPHHRISVATAHVHDELDAVVDASVWSMDPTETAHTLQSLTRVKARIAELEARVAVHAERVGVGEDVAASSLANWLAHQTKLTRKATNATVRLGHGLEQHPLTRDALAAGDVHEEQARVIVHWVDQLPDDLSPDLAEKAERHLLDQAQHHNATELARLGKHLFEVVAPDLADAHEAAILEAEEAKAARAITWRGWDDGHGTFHLYVTGPTLYGAMLTKMVLATAAPKHQRATQGAEYEPKPSRQRMGEAFWELISRYPTKKLPKAGGLNATVVVTIDEDSLMGRIEKAGILDTGEKISPAMARKIACEAGIIPAIMGGKSVVLDLGRKRRLYSDHQRIAMMLRDGGCTAEGCDRTTGLQAHHKKPWADGGQTNLADGVSLCHWHHNRAHDTNYETTYHPNGNVTFHRRT